MMDNVDSKINIRPTPSVEELQEKIISLQEDLANAKALSSKQSVPKTDSLKASVTTRGQIQPIQAIQQPISSTDYP